MEKKSLIGNDEGHVEFDTANDDILCITWSLF